MTRRRGMDHARTAVRKRWRRRCGQRRGRRRNDLRNMPDAIVRRTRARHGERRQYRDRTGQQFGEFHSIYSASNSRGEWQPLRSRISKRLAHHCAIAIAGNAPWWHRATAWSAHTEQAHANGAPQERLACSDVMLLLSQRRLAVPASPSLPPRSEHLEARTSRADLATARSLRRPPTPRWGR